MLAPTGTCVHVLLCAQYPDACPVVQSFKTLFLKNNNSHSNTLNSVGNGGGNGVDETADARKKTLSVPAPKKAPQFDEQHEPVHVPVRVSPHKPAAKRVPAKRAPL